MNIQDEFIGAVYSGDVAAARTLLQQGAKVGEGEILHTAAQAGRLDVLEILLQAGGLDFIDQFDELSFTPLAWAAKEGHLTVVKLLLRAGAKVNAVDAQRAGNTALHEAVSSGHLEVINELLAAGADPLTPGWMQITPLFKATQRGGEIEAVFNVKRMKADKVLSLARKRKNLGRHL